MPKEKLLSIKLSLIQQLGSILEFTIFTFRILMVDFLIQNGADLNVRNEKGETALHYAVHLQRKDLISGMTRRFLYFFDWTKLY